MRQPLSLTETASPGDGRPRARVRLSGPGGRWAGVAGSVDTTSAASFISRTHAETAGLPLRDPWA